MKNLSSILVILTGITFCSLSAQKSPMKFGKIATEVLEMEVYQPDSSAGAVVLCDYGVTKFSVSQDDGFYIDFSRHVRVKILNKNELGQSDFFIPLYVSGSREEKVTQLKAYTYNLEDGKVVEDKMDKSSIFREKIDKNHNSIKFSLPKVKVGSVIEVMYQIKSPFLFNLSPWYFQKTVPTKQSVYHVYMPEYFNYKNWTKGFVFIKKESETNKETFQYMQSATMDLNNERESAGMVSFEAEVIHWTYTANDIPAFNDEPYITCKNDYLSHLAFELVSTNFPRTPVKNYTKSWDDIKRELMDDEDFGGQLNNRSHLKDQAELISTATSDAKKKMVMGYEFIKNKLIWDGNYRTSSTSGIRKAFNEGGGSSADINLNLVSLLRELGLNANPVLVSIRSHGQVREYQSILTQFNHVVASVQIGELNYVLDAIDPYCPFFILPENSLARKGIMFSNTGYKWIDLNSKLPTKEVTLIDLKLSNELIFTGTMQCLKENYDAIDTRKLIKKQTNIEEYQKKLEQAGGFIMDSIIISNLDSIYYPLKLMSKVTFNDKIARGGDMLYFNPLLIDRWKENIFKKDERLYPIDFPYPISSRISINIQLPEGLEVVELPKTQKVALPDNGGSFSYSTTLMGSLLTLFFEFKLDQTIFPVEDYSNIQKFYELIVAKHAEQVVLKIVK